MIKKELYITCGASGSGKTSWIFNRAELNSAYISRDNIRFNILDKKVRACPDDSKYTSQEYFSCEKEVYKQYIKEINAAMAASYKQIFCDATHLTAKSRAKFFNNIDKDLIKEYDIVFVYCLTPLEEIVKRQEIRPHKFKVDPKICKEQLDSLEYVTINEILSYGIKEYKIIINSYDK